MGVTRLKEEVLEGKCDVALVRDEPVRTVFVIALRIFEDDLSFMHEDDAYNGNRFLVKIGDVEKANGGVAVKPSCVLPGTKRKEQEPANQALQRVLDGDLAEIASLLRVSARASQQQDVEMK